MAPVEYDDGTTVVHADDGGSDGGSERAALLVYGHDGARAHALVRGSALVVGRGSPSHVIVADPSLSRQHARVAWGTSASR